MDQWPMVLHLDSRRFLDETRDLQDVLRSNAQAVVNLIDCNYWTRNDKHTWTVYSIPVSKKPGLTQFIIQYLSVACESCWWVPTSELSPARSRAIECQLGPKGQGLESDPAMKRPFSEAKKTNITKPEIRTHDDEVETSSGCPSWVIHAKIRY